MSRQHTRQEWRATFDARHVVLAHGRDAHRSPVDLARSVEPARIVASSRRPPVAGRPGRVMPATGDLACRSSAQNARARIGSSALPGLASRAAVGVVPRVRPEVATALVGVHVRQPINFSGCLGLRRHNRDHRDDRRELGLGRGAVVASDDRVSRDGCPHGASISLACPKARTDCLESCKPRLPAPSVQERRCARSADLIACTARMLVPRRCVLTTTRTPLAAPRDQHSRVKMVLVTESSASPRFAVRVTSATTALVSQVGFWSDDEEPSPKVHSHDVGPPVVRSSK
jgi:hypothetical protein